jgi:protein-disulfide isomerase
MEASAVTVLVLAFAALACAAPPVPDDVSAAAPGVVARAGEQVITEAELERLAGPSLLQIRQQEYDTKVRILESELFERLVADAAQTEDLSVEAYLAREVDAKVAEPNEAEVQMILQQYRARLPQDDAQARAQVVAFLSQQQRARAEQELRERLFAEAGVEIFLDPPRVEASVSAANPSRGPENAPIVLVEYTDYQCPFCSRAQPTLTQLMERYDGMILHVFKNLPLPMHQQAGLAAEASLCAADQGEFWELHDWLFANASNLSRETIGAQAASMQLDMERFAACLDEGTHREQVEEDAAEARSFGITGTPGFLVNGRVITGAQPYEAFAAVIDDELRRSGVAIPADDSSEAEGATEVGPQG